LVAKFPFDTGLRKPARQDVVVFKYPGGADFPISGPQRNHQAMNYIKRMVGKPGETIGIYYGNLYVAEGLNYEGYGRPPQDQLYELRTPEFMYINGKDPATGTEIMPVAEWLKSDAKSDANKPDKDREKRFHIIRKAPDKLLSMSRLVYDNDHQADDLKGKQYQRWYTATDREELAWKAVNPENATVFEHASRTGPSIAWLRYRHVLRNSPEDGKGNLRPGLITDFMGYNSGIPAHQDGQSLNWTGDLILECEVKLDKYPGDDDELVLELSKGPDRFRARFHLKAGKITLMRITKTEEGTIRETPLDSMPTSRLRQPGSYKLRFANVDERLTLWVDGDLPFGDGKEYDPPWHMGPDKEDKDPAKNNDLQPASIGVKGAAVTVSHLVLRRDTYYTINGPRADAGPRSIEEWSDPTKWDELRNLPAKTMYVQPDHYLCMGDNSPESSDGREWGTVPDRLLLGRALLVYYPFSRMGSIR
jgi:signal peptidase I